MPHKKGGWEGPLVIGGDYPHFLTIVHLEALLAGAPVRWYAGGAMVGLTNRLGSGATPVSGLHITIDIAGTDTSRADAVMTTRQRCDGRERQS
jgi:hypothetical protein